MTLGARKRVLVVAGSMQRDEHVDLAALQAAGSMEAMLGLLHLSQYAPWFRDQDVDLEVFLTLLESDLEDVQVRGFAFMAHRVPSDTRPTSS